MVGSRDPETVEVLRGALVELCDATGVIYIDGIDAETRICVCRGRIAWVHAGNCGRFLSDRLGETLSMNPAELRTMLVTCRKTGRPLGEHVVSLGLLSQVQFRRLLQNHNREHLQALLVSGAADYDRWSFEERPDSYNPSFTFELGSLLAGDASAADPDDEAIEAALRGLGLRVGEEAWFVDRPGGRSWGRTSLPPDVASMLASVSESVCRGHRPFEVLAMAQTGPIVASASHGTVLVVRGPEVSSQPRLLRLVRDRAPAMASVITESRSRACAPTVAPARTLPSFRFGNG